MNLQTLITTLAPKHRASERGPVLAGAHFLRCDPRQAIAFDPDGSMLVWDGASDRTIYWDAAVNHAFRAWHDACHIAGRFGFNLDGERAACELQIVQARLAFPSIPLSIIATIRAEVVGQAEYFAAHGCFPLDQRKFVAQYIRTNGGL